MKAVQYTSVFIKPKYKYYILQSNHKAVGVLLSFCIPAYIYIYIYAYIYLYIYIYIYIPETRSKIRAIDLYNCNVMLEGDRFRSTSTGAVYKIR